MIDDMAQHGVASATAEVNHRPTSQAAGVGPHLITTISGIILCLMAPAWILSLLPDPAPSGNATALAILVLVISGARFSRLLGLGELRLMEFSFWTFTYIFMGLAPLVQMRSSDYPGTTPNPSLQLNSIAMFVVLTGAVFAWLGTLWRSSPKHQPVAEVSAPRVILLAGFGLVANAYWVAKVGPAAILGRRADLGNLIETTWQNPALSAMVGAFSKLPLLVTWLGLLQWRRQRREAGQKTSVILPVVVGCALLFSVNPISSARYIFGSVFLSFLMGLGAFDSARKVRLMSAMFFLALIFVFPLADAFRYAGDPDWSGILTLSSLTTGDFDSFVQVNNTLKYVAANGVTWGVQALGVLLFWVPREWWPAKPLDTGVLLAQFRGYSFENLSAPIWSELFINGGWLALVLGMFLLGVYMRKRDDSSVALNAIGQQPSILDMIVPFYLVFMLRGSLLQAMSYLLVTVICTAFIAKRSPKHEERSFYRT
jgi:hypothetical protein